MTSGATAGGDDPLASARDAMLSRMPAHLRYIESLASEREAWIDAFCVMVNAIAKAQVGSTAAACLFEKRRRRAGGWRRRR